LPVVYSILKSERSSYSVINDISLGGLNLTSEETLVADESLKIVVYLADDVLDCEGKVVWQNVLPDTEKFQAGIQFIHMNSPTKKKLSNFLQSLAH